MLARNVWLIFGFVLFCVAYYLPFGIDASVFHGHDYRVTELLHQALELQRVRLDLFINGSAHVIVLAVIFTVIVWTAKNIALVLRTNTVLSAILLSLCVLIFLTSVNGLYFPLSNYSVAFQSVVSWIVLLPASLLLLLAVGLVVWRSLHAISFGQLARSDVIAIFVGLSAVSTLHFLGSTSGTIVHPGKNVILIGVDSLSNQIYEETRAHLPHIKNLLQKAERFDRAYTPLARTFPAWLSIMTGRSPAEHGAIFNLRSLSMVEKSDIVTHDLRKIKYQTLFAMDERRFSNIDESFGFDSVIGPTVGALDFVLQEINDTPLTNVLLQTRLASHMLPFSHLNVAARASYDANGFVDEILRKIKYDKSLFLAVHFQLAHYPFETAQGMIESNQAHSFVGKHKGALAAVDQQVGRLINGLKALGKLENALVVILSDHGESLGFIEARTTRGGKPIEIAGHGHGVSLLSEYQSRIVLGVIEIENGVFKTVAGNRVDQVSLLDLRELINNYVYSGQAELRAHHPCIYVETGVRFGSVSSYSGLNLRAVAREAANYYEINSDGRLQLSESKLSELIDGKDVGLRCRDRITYYSAIDKSYFSYKIGSDGNRITEIAINERDVEQIEGYRMQLRKGIKRKGTKDRRKNR